jgi:hypothetical protein
LQELTFFGNTPSLGDDVFKDSASNFTVIIHPTSRGFQNTFEGRPVTIADVPVYPTPRITKITFTHGDLAIQVQEAASAAPLTLYSSSDLETWKRMSTGASQNGTFHIPQDHPDLGKKTGFFEVRISYH